MVTIKIFSVTEMYILNTESIFHSISHFICMYQFLQKDVKSLHPKNFLSGLQR